MGRLGFAAHGWERRIVHRALPRREAGEKSSRKLLEHDWMSVFDQSDVPVPVPQQASLADVGQGFRYVAWGVAALMAWLVFSGVKARR